MKAGPDGNERPYPWFPALLMATALFLSGCSLTDILTGGAKTAYDITPHDQDKETTAYLEEILAARVRDRTGDMPDEAEERAAHENYTEQSIRADLQAALRARGYYQGHVIYRDSDKPLTGTYVVDYGPKFSIAALAARPDSYTGDIDGALIAVGDALDAARVLTAQLALQKSVARDRCYFSLSLTNEVVLDQVNSRAALTYVVDAGEEGNFGPISFSGQQRVRESYLRKLLPWAEGECYDRQKIEDYKTKLLQSGLFARAEVILPDKPDEDGLVPVKIDLRERAQRSISAGATYYSDEGLGGQFGWEHRNILGSAEKLSADLTLSLLKQSLSFTFLKPYFLHDRQTLSLNTTFTRQESDAYDELGIKAGGALKRSLGKNWAASSGLDIALTRIKDKTTNENRTFGLVSLPHSVSYDTRDDPLDPRRGLHLNAGAEPFFDVLGEADPFFRILGTGSTYFPLGTGADLVFATKASIGSIWGADTADVPSNKRFYAGGGGSVRGYGFQEVGPKKNGEPSGGSAIVGLSFELRGKFTDKIGAVAFVDAASIGADPAPSFDNMAVGAGAGLRYYTDFGPIRFDVAVPLTQKDELDQNYQFYISIGQAF